MQNNRFKYYDIVSKRLDHSKIIQAIKTANEYFRRGDICRCRDMLSEVIAAINECEEDRLK